MLPRGSSTATTLSMRATISIPRLTKSPNCASTCYGFNAGGQVPLWKSHPTFFFYNMEWRSLVQGGLFNQTVPLASTYGGEFPTAGADAVTNQCTHHAVQPWIHCPATETSWRWTHSWKRRSPNNTIPDLYCSIPMPSAAEGRYFPANVIPQLQGYAQFIGGNNSPTNVREEIARIDHQFTDKFSVFGHWVSEQVSQTYGDHAVEQRQCADASATYSAIPPTAP